jgi:hypothetical protein
MFALVKFLKHTTLAIILINLSVIVYDFNMFPKREHIKPEYVGFKEQYIPEYFKKIQTIEEFKQFVLVEAKRKKTKKSDFEFLELINEVVKNRFYFNGYAFYNASENIFLYLLGRFVWDDFGAIISPEHILKKEHAACSQQAIVLMRMFREFGYDVRKVTLNFHFTLEVKHKGKWYFFDPTFEPNFKTEQRNSVEYLTKHMPILHEVYAGVADSKDVDWRFSKTIYGKINDKPAKKMILVHDFFFFYEKYLIIITFFLFLNLLYIKYRIKKKD